MFLVSQQTLNLIFMFSAICGTMYFIYDFLFCNKECIFSFFIRIILLILILLCSVIGFSGLYYYIETKDTIYLYRIPFILPLTSYWFYIFTQIY